MNTKDIRNGLKERLAGAGLSPAVVWPNVEPNNPPSTPYFELSTQLIDRQGGTLKGGQIVREVANFSVIVVTEEGQGEDAALDLADAVAALFPEGQRFNITGGQILIPRPPSIRGGFKDGPDWRTPVVIRYEATAS